MGLITKYDPDADLLTVGTEHTTAEGVSLEDDMNIVVMVGTLDGNDVAQLMLINATSFLTPYFTPHKASQECSLAVSRPHPMVRYVISTDTLTFGKTDTAAVYTTSAEGHVFAHWEPDDLEPDGLPWKVIGVSLCQASQHLAPFFTPIR